MIDWCWLGFVLIIKCVFVLGLIKGSSVMLFGWLFLSYGFFISLIILIIFIGMLLK